MSTKSVVLVSYIEKAVAFVQIGYESIRLERKPRQILYDLSTRQREAVELHHFQGLAVVETGELLGISEGAVKRHLHRRYGRLRDIIKAVCLNNQCSNVVKM